MQVAAKPAMGSDVGLSLGQTLLWSNQVAAVLGANGNPTLGSQRFGYGMKAAELPELIAAGAITSTGGVESVSPTTESSGAVDSIVAMDGSVTVTFDYSSSSYTAQGFSLDTLSYDSSTDLYTLIDSAGDTLKFHGFGNSSVTEPALEQGQLYSIDDAAGNHIGTSYDSSGHLTEADLYASGNLSTIVDQYLFTYGSSVSPDLVSNVQLKRSVGGTMTVVQQVAYTYYDGTYGFKQARTPSAARSNTAISGI